MARLQHFPPSSAARSSDTIKEARRRFVSLGEIVAQGAFPLLVGGDTRFKTYAVRLRADGDDITESA